MKQHREQHRAQITTLLENYQQSGLTRAAFCEQVGIAVSTLDYYRRQQAKPQNQVKQKQRLIRVNIETKQASESRFTIVLANGRRIETGEHFAEEALARLIRTVEKVA